ncbi:hypothetical protein BAXH7_00933 [Bacillus amyloliquefaciens XH7]|nr:hypothetical protein LL3_01038 [Bacillus amyloliquefaciens LL3]AEK88075.1 hypothetical protein BAXH7_00933 [Bacillus amyloliquefaciens XH7]KYC92651.1 hypothetical protein B425_0983 [Bacillus amyloliquefaciens]
MIIICIFYCITTQFFLHFQIFLSYKKTAFKKEDCRYLLRK